MPLGKYHCDYCDKEFQDTPAARKRHLQGVYHQRAKALWYDSLHYGNQVPDPESINKKGVCNRFIRTNLVERLVQDFGERLRRYKIYCPLARLTFEELRYESTTLSLMRRTDHVELKGSCQYGDSCKYYHPRQNLQNLDAEKTSGINFTEVQPQALPGSQTFFSASFPGNIMGDNIGISWGNLPPSLRPPPESGYPPLPFIDWG